MTLRTALLIGDEPEQFAHIVTDLGYEPVLVNSLAEVQDIANAQSFAFSLVDVAVSPTERAQLVRELKALTHGSTRVIVALDRGLVGRDGDADGADAVVAKPVDRRELELALESARPREATPRPRGDDAAARLAAEIDLWRSPRMRELVKIIQQAATIDITVLVTGETGTGKDLVARAVHQLSPRRHRPFVKVNCAAVPRELLESELFGHERGAFTGAHQLKIGKFEAAHQGTIFLDEIGDLHAALQAKLLHVLQDGEFPRVGGKSTVKVDVRVIAATNQDLEAAVAADRFREDLYYRLNVIQIEVPPLRERIDEIPYLVNYFVERYSKLYGRDGFSVPPRVMERLIHHHYQGNVRELENLVKRMIVLNDPALTRVVLPRLRGNGNGHANGDAVPEAAHGNGDAQSVSLKDIVKEAILAAERRTITNALEQTRWNRVKAAKLLSISYRALLYKMKHIGLEPKRTPQGPRV